MRQSKEESLIMWKVERSTLDIIGKNFKELTEIVDKLMNNYSLTYEEFRNDMADVINDLRESDDKSLSSRRGIIDVMCEALINKYKEYDDKQSSVEAEQEG